MKLLYEFAFALQRLLPKQMKVDAMRTGRLPKHIWIGTLETPAGSTLKMGWGLPDEIAKSKHQNSYTSKLNDICQVSVESLDINAEHRCLYEGQRKAPCF